MNYYDLCCKHKGKEVCIYDKCGKQYVGKIVHVDRQYVYLQPNFSSNLGGFSYGYAPGFYGFGGAVPIALAAIAGFALASAFFWW